MEEWALPSRRELLARGTAALAAGSLAACRGPGASASDEAERSARQDELLAALTDQSGSVPPIGASERAERRARLGRKLADDGIDALLMEGGPTMTWCAGVGWGHSERLFALVVLADGSHFWLCPAFEASRARLAIEGRAAPGGAIVTWEEHEYAFCPLASALRERRVATLAIEPAFRHGFVDRLAGELGADTRIVSGAPAVAALRSRKDAHELALLRRANELTQLAIRTVAEHLEPGLGGDEIGALLDRAHERLGMRRPWCLALLGPEAALPHGGLGERRLAPGELVLVDTGASLHDYQSDITRTWIHAGRPSAEVERAWNTVRDAQLAAYEALAPGVRCGEIDRTARDVIDAAGYGPGYRAFTHRLGHGIGLAGHEDPYFDLGSDVALEPGMTLSDEPGIYLPERFGVRLEDIVAVTEDCGEHFGAWQRSPTSPA